MPSGGALAGYTFAGLGGFWTMPSLFLTMGIACGIIGIVGAGDRLHGPLSILACVVVGVRAFVVTLSLMSFDFGH